MNQPLRQPEPEPVASVGGLGVGDLVADRYVVEEVLGHGSFGIVVAARHEALGSRVAIKVLARSAEADAFERFAREAKIIASLSSEHVVSVRDFGMHGASPFMVMDLLQGRDLRRELELRGPLPIEEAVDHIISACEGLRAAHDKGIVHRDVKPANLFLETTRSGDRVIKLLDFGVAKLAPSEAEATLTQSDTAVGSPSYMAPEQIRDARGCSPRSDIFSLGVTLYKLVTNQLPFQAASSSGMLAAILVDEPIALRERVNVRPSLEAVVMRCLEKAPAERFADVTSLAKALAPFASARGRAIAERMPSATPEESIDVAVEVPVAPPRRRVQLAVIAGALLVGTIGMGAWVSRSHPKESSNETRASSSIAATIPIPSSTLTSSSAPSDSARSLTSDNTQAATSAPVRSTRGAQGTSAVETRPAPKPRVDSPRPVTPPRAAGSASLANGFGGSALDDHK